MQNLNEENAPARKIVKRAPSRTVRLLNLKGLLPHPVEAESTLEAHYVRRAALSPTTTDVIAQPFVLPVSPNGYTPDFLQVNQPIDCKAVIEVKPEKKIKKYADLFDRSAELLKANGYVFYVLTDRHLCKDKIHERSLLLRRYAKARFAEIERLKVVATLREYEHGLAIGSLVRKSKSCRELIIHLVARKIFTTGPRLMIDNSAVVRLPEFSRLDEAMTLDRWFNAKPWGCAR